VLSPVKWKGTFHRLHTAGSRRNDQPGGTGVPVPGTTESHRTEGFEPKSKDARASSNRSFPVYAGLPSRRWNRVERAKIKSLRDLAIQRRRRQSRTGHGRTRHGIAPGSPGRSTLRSLPPKGNWNWAWGRDRLAGPIALHRLAASPCQGGRACFFKKCQADTPT
jgi:hypothetical protein